MALKARLREARYALPEQIGGAMPVGTPQAAAQACAKLGARGIVSSAGFFARDDAPPEQVADAYCALIGELRALGCDTLPAVKLPQLGFDAMLLRRIAAQGMPLMVDSLTHEQAPQVLALAREAGAGVALPARWARSVEDAVRLRDTPCRIRLIKGEWADPAGDPGDIAAAYLALARQLAGRRAPVGVASHDPVLAEAALRVLRDAGTPVELEQLRGLPRRRTMAVARRMGVAARLYYSFGPGWWPYAIEQALRRPYLPLWALRDALG